MIVQVPVASRVTDEELQFIREMGVSALSMTFLPAHTDYDQVMHLRQRCAKFDLTITDGGCNELFKNAAIHLGLPGRDQAIEKYNAFTRVLGRAGIPIGYIAWQPSGILRSFHGPGRLSHGGVTMGADLDEIMSRPPQNDRVYDESEIWGHFAYFLEHVLPVCEETGVRLALHPNDPPAPILSGVPSLIWNTACYRRAFALAQNSPYLGMKLCVGCWLEGGDRFGNLMEDIESFCRADRIYAVHFRNVSSPLPCFEEVLCEDGYADPYPIIKQLVRCGYNGVISVDHAFEPKLGGRTGGMAYPTGFLKGLLFAARRELGLPGKPQPAATGSARVNENAAAL